MEDHGGVDIDTAAHGGPHARPGGYALKEAADHKGFTLELAPGRRKKKKRCFHLFYIVTTTE